MAKQSLRQAARKRVSAAVAPWQKERLERERRVQTQAVDLLAALAERDHHVARTEMRAGAAIRAMLADGLTLADIADWSGGEIDQKEARRLSRAETEPLAGRAG